MTPYRTTIPKIILLSEAQNWRCAYCFIHMEHRHTDPDPKSDRTATIDHVIAKGSGGHTGCDNEVAACLLCNVAKQHYSAVLFYLLMQDMGHNRRAVSKRMAGMTRKERHIMRNRINRTQRRLQQANETYGA